MAKKTKTKRFSLQGFDNKHYRTTQQYVNAVNALFDRATTEIANATAKGTYDPNKPFSLNDYPQIKATVQNITTGLANNITSVVERGSRKQWLFACQKNDDFVASIMDTSKLSKARLNKMQDRNLDALNTFQARKVNGMELSKRVWQYVGQYKDQIELGLDVGLGDGRSAQQLARDLKKNLIDPDRLFRRVRDKHGNLQLSKAAKAFHPGQGVYRSSVKNAQRLTRSEINMAYREADWLRWQQLDFVVGFEVKTSERHEEWLRTVWNKSNKGKVEICDQLKGRYPKTFKFKGWHPQCMCYCVPILMDEETFDEQELSDLKSALKGTEYKKLEAKNTVKDVPQGFKDWVDTNTEKQANWGSTPYFVKDNFKDGQLSHGLNHAAIIEPPKPIDPIQQELDLLAPQIAAIKLRASEYGSQTMALDNFIARKDIQQIKRQIRLLESDFNDLDAQYTGFANKAAQAVQDAKTHGVNVLGKLATPITKNNWYSDPTSYEAELDKLIQEIELKKNKFSLDEVVKSLDNANVDYKEVKTLAKELTETEIISRVGGGDLTRGSCSSLAFTYAGNKCGFDVLDFRDGVSRQKFSSSSTIMNIAEKAGGVVVKHTNDFTKANDLLKQTQVGKEYYFTCGSHAAIIRKTATGYEYLELQSPKDNGFKPLTTNVLKNRFGAKKSHTSYGSKYETKECLVDIDLLKSNPDFKKMLGYINTAEDKQKKGERGSRK